MTHFIGFWLQGTRFCLAFWFQAGEGCFLFFWSQVLGGDQLPNGRPYLLKIVVNFKAKTCSPQGRLLSPIHKLVILLSVTLESGSPAFSLTWYWKFIKWQHKMLCFYCLNITVGGDFVTLWDPK